MKLFRVLLLVAAGAIGMQAAVAADVAAPVKKNWTAPNHKIAAQVLIEELMKADPGLLSVTFHGTPPGQSKLYTMFAGTWPDRIGKVSSEDDIMVIENGFTIIDPRWNKQDPEPKFLVLLPLRDAQRRNVGCIVFAFKNPASARKTEETFLREANALRDGLQPKIADHAALFTPAT